MAGDMHAWDSRKDGSRRMNLQKTKSCEGFTFHEFSLKQAQENRGVSRRTKRIFYTNQHIQEEDIGPMALSEEARQWLKKNGLEGLLCIADAPPHAEPEQAVATIDLSKLTEGAVQALTGLPTGGLRSIESPSNQILFEYFGEYSLSSKAYRMQRG